MSDGDFKNGDIVQLKSGGPKMTIISIGEYTSLGGTGANCSWFIQDKAPWKKDSDVFPLHALKKISD